MIKNYNIEKKLGKGTYGDVYMVSKEADINEKKEKKNLYVIKQIPLFGLTPTEIKDVRSEADILSQIKSNYVVKYFDSFEENNYLNIVMEYCDGGDLEQLIQDKKKFPLEEELIWKIFIQITIGLTSIHNLKILHRDLKSQNIFLTKDLKVKIGDLGVAKKLTRGRFAKTIIGTPYYLSPEICEEKPYNEKSDVWALGCILYELCTFRHPFEAKSQGALILRILNDFPTPIKSSYSENLKAMIKLILEKNFRRRPSCKVILKTPHIMEKVKKFGMVEQYKSIGLTIGNKINKGNKININDDKKIMINKTNSHFMKNDNPWKNDFKKEKKIIIKKNTIENIKNINEPNNKNNRKKDIKKNVSPINNKNNQKNKLGKSVNSGIKQKKFNNNINKKDDNKDNNKKEKEEIKMSTNVDLSSTLNQIINDYLNKGDNFGDSNNSQIPKEVSEKLNNFFSNNINDDPDLNNKINSNKSKPSLKLANIDNNIDPNEMIGFKTFNNEDNLSNKKEHKNILNYNLERISLGNLGISSFDDLLKDFSARGSLNKNSQNKNNNTNSFTPFDNQNQINNNLNDIRESLFQIINNNKCNNPSENQIQIDSNSNSIRDSLFQIFDNKAMIFNISNKDNNSCESDDEKYINLKTNLDSKNIDYEENTDNENDESSSGEENVKVITYNEDDKHNPKKDNNYKDIKEKEKENIIEDKKLLTERLENLKKEMLVLIGEEDYKHVMDLYSKIDKSKIDEIYVEIEEYAQKYDEEKKDKFDILYFKLISTDYQIQQKNSELKKIFLNDF